MEELESKIKEIVRIFQVAREYSTSTIQAMGIEACNELRDMLPQYVSDEDAVKTGEELAREAYRNLLLLQSYNLAAEVKKTFNL